MNACREIISETPIDAQKEMSIGEITRILHEEKGLPQNVARKAINQLRNTGPLYAEWRAAFDSGRFVQKNGRPRAGTGPPNFSY